MASAPVPGWYADNFDPNVERLWDGGQWTENTRPRQNPASDRRESSSPKVLGWGALTVMVVLLVVMMLGKLNGH